MKKNRLQRSIGCRMRAKLTELFPRCFAGKRQPKRPLKINIHLDILERQPLLLRRHVRLALADYTGGATYLREMIVGAERIDLDGKPAGIVTAEAAEMAIQSLQRMEENNRTQAARAAARKIEQGRMCRNDHPRPSQKRLETQVCPSAVSASRLA